MMCSLCRHRRAAGAQYSELDCWMLYDLPQANGNPALLQRTFARRLRGPARVLVSLTHQLQLLVCRRQRRGGTRELLRRRRTRDRVGLKFLGARLRGSPPTASSSSRPIRRSPFHSSRASGIWRSRGAPDAAHRTQPFVVRRAGQARADDRHLRGRARVHQCPPACRAPRVERCVDGLDGRGRGRLRGARRAAHRPGRAPRWVDRDRGGRGRRAFRHAGALDDEIHAGADGAIVAIGEDRLVSVRARNDRSPRDIRVHGFGTAVRQGDTLRLYAVIA